MLKEKKIILVVSLSAIFVLLAIFLLSYLYYINTYQDRLLAKSYLGNHDISHMTRPELEQLIENEVAKIRSEGLQFSYNEEVKTLPLSLQTDNPDLPSLDLKYAESFDFHKKDNLNLIFDKKNRTFLNFLVTKLNKSYRNIFSIKFSYSPEILTEWLNENFVEANIEPENAYLSLDNNNLINNPEKIGKEIDQNVLKNDLISRLSNLNNERIVIKTKSKYPLITQAELENLKDLAKKIIEKGDLELFFSEEIKKRKEKLNFSVKPKDYISWLVGTSLGGNLEIEFDKNKISNYLKENIASSVDQEVILPRFDVKDARVLSWQVGKNGREIDLEKSTENIIAALNSDTFVAEILAQEINVANFDIENDFKIKELIGTGQSNFAGSPYNRRHNIKVGADAVHGLLIKPGEEFSLVENLGEIDAANGYLPELVIKGDKTIPEYGGGLCQVATTIFRSALGSGLPITARRNHSYRVSYYEPAGMDASVYDPWPDIKFLNDTGNYVLIQSRIEGDILYFDFWGTDDGRTATTTKPVIYNIVPPPPTKIIETDKLKPGQKKCTESPHSGADAYFDYIVTYPEGATSTPRQEVRFNSHYVPWQEVCLVGKEEAPETDLDLEENDSQTITPQENNDSTE